MSFSRRAQSRSFCRSAARRRWSISSIRLAISPGLGRRMILSRVLEPGDPMIDPDILERAAPRLPTILAPAAFVIFARRPIGGFAAFLAAALKINSIGHEARIPTIP